MQRYCKTGPRNRWIFVCFASGCAIESLAAQYSISPVSVRAIIRSEYHKLTVSPDTQYCQLRETLQLGTRAGKCRLNLNKAEPSNLH